MPLKKTTLTLAVAQILWNIILIAPLNIKVFITDGGPWGYGIALSVITVPIFIFSLVAFIYSVINLEELSDSKKGLVLNSIAFAAIFLFISLIMLPVEPYLPQLIKMSWTWS